MKDKEQMKWRNLKENKCPKCNADLANAHYNEIKEIISCACGFAITKGKMTEIVSDQVRKSLG